MLRLINRFANLCWSSLSFWINHFVVGPFFFLVKLWIVSWIKGPQNCNPYCIVRLRANHKKTYKVTVKTLNSIVAVKLLTKSFVNLILKAMGLIINNYLEWVVVIMLMLFLASFSRKNYWQIVLSKVSRICWKCTTCPNLFSPSIPHLPEGCKIEAPHLILLRFSVPTAVLRSFVNLLS